jgi:hypothetical protein
MLLPVMIKGKRLLTLLDTGSTHTFLQGTAMRRLGLAPQGGDHLRVTVANGERVTCEGIARNVPIAIYGALFSITNRCWMSSYFSTTPSSTHRVAFHPPALTTTAYTCCPGPPRW